MSELRDHKRVCPLPCFYNKPRQLLENSFHCISVTSTRHYAQYALLSAIIRLGRKRLHQNPHSLESTAPCDRIDEFEEFFFIGFVSASRCFKQSHFPIDDHCILNMTASTFF